jgi:hypothetical protein
MNKTGQPLSGCQEKQIVYNMLWLEEARYTQNRYMQVGYGSLRGPSVFFFLHDTNRFSIEKDFCVVSQCSCLFIFHLSWQPFLLSVNERLKLKY